MFGLFCTNRPRTERRARLGLEALEGREVPAAVANLTGSVLVIRGDESNDVIDVGGNTRRIRVAGGAYLTRRVSTIVVVGEGGNDTITVSQTVGKTTWLYGGSGEDTIRGGRGRDYIYGGTWDDALFGGGGGDYIWGGGGSDTIDGEAGTNVVADGPANRTAEMDEFDAEVVRLTNLERTSRGLSALAVNPQLVMAADVHALQMRNRSQTGNDVAAMNHELWGVTRPTMTSRMEFVGYEYSSVRENIAYGYPTAAAVVAAWMDSPGHRDNILSTDVTEIGVGSYVNRRGIRFYCQNFGNPL